MAAAMNKAMCVALIAAVMLAAVAPPAEALGCGDVVTLLSPCLRYVTNRGPIGTCCDGVKGLNSAARTTPDRKQACACLKSLAATAGGVDLKKAAGLPSRCGVNIPYKISPDTDCNKVR